MAAVSVSSSIDSSLICAASAADTAMLGKSGLVVSALGIGTLQWGDPQCGFSKQYTEVRLRLFNLREPSAEV